MGTKKDTWERLTLDIQRDLSRAQRERDYYRRTLERLRDASDCPEIIKQTCALALEAGEILAR